MREHTELREGKNHARLLARVTEYLSVGGLFNPESMHPQDAARDLIMDLAVAIRNLQAAYTAAHSELERAVADLAACREVADGLREDAERLDWVQQHDMSLVPPEHGGHGRMVVKRGRSVGGTYVAGGDNPRHDPRAIRTAIDAAIKEQSHD